MNMAHAIVKMIHEVNQVQYESKAVYLTQIMFWMGVILSSTVLDVCI